MTDSTARRRGHGEDASYFDAAKNRYVGRTKQEVRDKLKALHAGLDRGLRTSATHTVRQAVADWLEGGLPGRSERTRSVYKEALTPLMGQIGSRPLKARLFPSRRQAPPRPQVFAMTPQCGPCRAIG
ncbi:hypothetical protein EAS64_29215 [Trebonia kvetii]|uniref:Integrase SAM-like N-terminal domain-containing protein n=1 Tax=Trebonia kvetii TaxID=2480626 RepID=A0A6P2BU00_9ACTN|nr:hypothetical protein [Trebonia kvetii]TVZ01575.1 hypothetical protein EAS64_29215 [Trebonia kvetii]